VNDVCEHSFSILTRLEVEIVKQRRQEKGTERKLTHLREKRGKPAKSKIRQEKDPARARSNKAARSQLLVLPTLPSLFSEQLLTPLILFHEQQPTQAFSV
jgi:hypothetical protein